MTGNPTRVLIVDDSAVVRGILTNCLKDQPDIQILGTASNGKLALFMLEKTPADVITLDIEMPEMDGITALPEILKICPQARVIMVSTLTQRNASVSIKALALGASDYLAKPTASEHDLQPFYRELLEKVRALAPRKTLAPATSAAVKIAPAASPAATVSAAAPVARPLPSMPKTPVRALAIGSSTGGPQALTSLFKGIAPRFPKNIPVFITQHMPPTFTTILAEHIAQAAGRPCTEGKDGEEVIAGNIYLAPGNFHMQPEKIDGKVVIKLNQNPQVNFCRPAVDPMLQSLVKIYGPGLLSVILTGMGSDGLGGCRDVVAQGGTVVAQNEQTSVVWGMPKAVADNNLCSAILPLDDIAPYIIKACS